MELSLSDVLVSVSCDKPGLYIRTGFERTAIEVADGPFTVMMFHKMCSGAVRGLTIMASSTDPRIFDSIDDSPHVKVALYGVLLDYLKYLEDEITSGGLNYGYPL
ncbi:MAG: hypothetical protein LBV23_00575 [Deltaproteobacteria bacterium]|jgi:hypothetical protein|nr:hypothetical protein [Deltaproteobacteria bacterium]